jgi:hypothetical protein
VSPKVVREEVVEIGANRQSREPSTTLLFKLVLDVIRRTPGMCGSS